MAYDLPIDDVMPQVIDALRASGRVVLQAPPGAGKTTRVPLAMLDAGLTKGKIIMLEPRRLEMGHARALLTLAPELAGKLAQEAADEGWSVREVERRAQAFAAGKVPSNRPAATPKVQQADIASLETELSEALGAKVAINHGRGGKGKLIIHYTDLDTLDGVLEKLRTRQG